MSLSWLTSAAADAASAANERISSVSDATSFLFPDEKPAPRKTQPVVRFSIDEEKPQPIRDAPRQRGSAAAAPAPKQPQPPPPSSSEASSSSSALTQENVQQLTAKQYEQRIATLTAELNDTKLRALKKLKAQEEDLGTLQARLAVITSERDDLKQENLALQAKARAAEEAARAATATPGATPSATTPRAGVGGDDAGDLAVPKVSWFPGFFNPQSFLTAVMQVRARARRSLTHRQQHDALGGGVVFGRGCVGTQRLAWGWIELAPR